MYICSSKKIKKPNVVHWDAKLCAQAMHNVSFSKISNLNLDNFNSETEKNPSFLASNQFFRFVICFRTLYGLESNGNDMFKN